MKKTVILTLIGSLLLTMALVGCGQTETASKAVSDDLPAIVETVEPETTQTTEPVEKTATTSSSTQTKPSTSTSTSSSSSSSSYSSSTSFTNKYGTPTTMCAHPGCTNYIASSGDTNCCTTHSRKCLECGKYIDEDAMYCMSCLSGALGGSSSGSSSSYSSGYSSSSSSSSGHECYICGDSATKKVGSYWYCSSCAAMVEAFSY